MLQKKENIFLLGGHQSGKTQLAIAIGLEASRLNYSVEFLNKPTGVRDFLNSDLLESGRLFNEEEKPAVLRKELLECDLLIVDQTLDWFERVSVHFVCLLLKRLELGKSNILIFPTFAKQQHSTTYPIGRNGYWPSSDTPVLQKMFNGLRTVAIWRFLDRSHSLHEVLHVLGIKWHYGDKPHQQREISEFLDANGLRCVERECFDSRPIWHSINTGEFDTSSNRTACSGFEALFD